MIIKGVLLEPGTVLVTTKKAPLEIGIPPGQELSIVVIEGPNVGVYSARRVKGWHSLDDRVPHEHGYWLDESNVFRLTELSTQTVRVKDNIIHKGKNLKGLPGKRLFSSEYFNCTLIEFDEDVGGTSGDGQGKPGHCVVVPSRSLERVELTKEEKKNK